MRQINCLLAFLAVSACCYSGCESDVIKNEDGPSESQNACKDGEDCGEATICVDSCEEESLLCDKNALMQCQKNELGCLVWTVKEQCESGTYCDDSTLKCESGCSEVCPATTELRCNESGLLKCTTDSSGCAVWEEAGQCPEGTVCNLETSQCAPECKETCDPDSLVQCTDKGVDYCEDDVNGCAVHRLEACEKGAYCDSALLKCVACEEVCDPAALKRCVTGGVETCSSDARGCAVWTRTETCGANQSCDVSTLKCIDGCTDACTAGEKKCSQGGVAECRDTNNDGCVEWDKAVKCQTGKTCDEKSKTCVCKDACTAGATKCEGNNIYTCGYNASGCLEWSKGESCGTGKMCNSAKTECVYTCGKDCEPFTIVLIPDTQNYARVSKGESNIYTRQMKWIKANEAPEKENIRAAIHLGDITDNNTEAQWAVGDYAHAQYLDKSKIPYSISTGNHDYKGGSGYGRDRTKFNKYFGPDRFKGKAWYHESPYVGNSYVTFSVGDIKFLILALEYSARKDVICWADELIKKYPDHHVIIETHNYLATNASKYTSNSVFGNHGYTRSAYLPDATHGAGGYDLYNELVARHSNVIMAVCGHVGDSEWRQKTAFNKNIVTEMLVDYQFDAPCHEASVSMCTSHCAHVTNAGNGWLRLLRFNPMTNTVKAETITVLENSEFAGSTPAFYCSELSSNKNVYNKAVNHKDHQFSFSCDFTTPVNYKYSTNNYLGFAIRNINSNGNGEQLNPAAAMNRTTGALVAVWEDDSSGDDGTATAGPKKGQANHDIMARVFYGGGCQKVKQFPVSVVTAGDQMTPAVATDKNGNFVVVWSDDKDGNGYYEIFMRGFDEKGVERIATKVVNTNSNGQQRNPAIAMAPDGRFVVAWEDESDSATTPQIFIRGFDANGNETFSARNVETLAGVRRNPSIAMDDNANFVVAWEEDIESKGLFQIRAKGFKAKGGVHFNAFTVNSVADGQQYHPAVSMNASGTFVIAYEDDADGNGLYRVKAVGYKADGTIMFKDMYISKAGENAVSPDLCVMKNNDVIYTWSAKALNNGDIRIRSYKSGKLNDNTFSANAIEDGIQDQPALGCTDSGKFAVLWHDDLDGNGYYEIFGHGYNEM